MSGRVSELWSVPGCQCEPHGKPPSSSVGIPLSNFIMYYRLKDPGFLNTAFLSLNIETVISVTPSLVNNILIDSTAEKLNADKAEAGGDELAEHSFLIQKEWRHTQTHVRVSSSMGAQNNAWRYSPLTFPKSTCLHGFRSLTRGIYILSTGTLSLSYGESFEPCGNEKTPVLSLLPPPHSFSTNSNIMFRFIMHRHHHRRSFQRHSIVERQ